MEKDRNYKSYQTNLSHMGSTVTSRSRLDLCLVAYRLVAYRVVAYRNVFFSCVNNESSDC